VNIADSVDRAARHHPDHAAIVFEGGSVTYAELRRAVDRTAHGLRGMGVGTGDRVALFLPNVPAFPIAYLAVQKLGAIAVSVNTMLTSAELGYVIDDSGAGVVFTTADLLPRVGPLLSVELEAGRVVVCEGEAAAHPRLGDLGRDAPCQALEMDRDDPAAILYTSGTTGQQKGALLSHGNVVSNTHATGELLRVDPRDRLLLFLPLFHCFGQNFIMNTALKNAATLVLHRRFVADEVLESLTMNGVTMFFAVPTVFIGLLNAGVQQDRLAGVRYFFSAAATLPVDVGTRWRDAYARPIYEGYGLTETSPFASYNHEWEHRPGSVGTPIETVEVKVVDPADQEVPAGTWGEILIRGPNVMLGYWNRPEETAEALRGGWFHTGDIGYRDEDGYLFLVDRVKDMINTAGFKIWPREVEEVLYKHPAIKECAVVGIPDELKGEIAKAFVVCRADTQVTAPQLEAHCREQLATYKLPSAFEFLEELPKSPTGKILKRLLREQAASVETRA
jgi:long-chain acyl-CoA synthetase